MNADPSFQKLMVLKMKGKAYLGWMRIRIADYVSATRFFKCLRYDHISKYCKNNQVACGHCADMGHSYRDCPSLQSPAKCRACMERKLDFNHSVKSKTCPTFLVEAKKVIMSTDYI